VELAAPSNVYEKNAVSARDCGFFEFDVIVRKPADRVQPDPQGIARICQWIDEKVPGGRNELLGRDGQQERPGVYFGQQAMDAFGGQGQPTAGAQHVHTDPTVIVSSTANAEVIAIETEVGHSVILESCYLNSLLTKQQQPDN